MVLGVDSACNRNEYQESSWRKGGWCIRLTASLPSVSQLSRKMWEPPHLTTQWDSTTCYRDSFTFLSIYFGVTRSINAQSVATVEAAVCRHIYSDFPPPPHFESLVVSYSRTVVTVHSMLSLFYKFSIYTAIFRVANLYI
jgi:hypothetical protein